MVDDQRCARCAGGETVWSCGVSQPIIATSGCPALHASAPRLAHARADKEGESFALVGEQSYDVLSLALRLAQLSRRPTRSTASLSDVLSACGADGEIRTPFLAQNFRQLRS